MAAKRKQTGRARLFALEDMSVVQVHAMLFTGNALGGQALTALLDEYREQGPYSPARGALIKHLQRVLAELIGMDATIIARCHLDAARPLPIKIKRLLASVKG